MLEEKLQHQVYFKIVVFSKPDSSLHQEHFEVVLVKIELLLPRDAEVNVFSIVAEVPLHLFLECFDLPEFLEVGFPCKCELSVGCWIEDLFDVWDVVAEACALLALEKSLSVVQLNWQESIDEVLESDLEGRLALAELLAEEKAAIRISHLKAWQSHQSQIEVGFSQGLPCEWGVTVCGSSFCADKDFERIVEVEILVLKEQSPLVFDCLPRQCKLPKVVQDQLILVRVIDFFIDFVPDFLFVESAFQAVAVDWYQSERILGVTLVLHELVIRVWMDFLVDRLKVLLLRLGPGI